MPRARKEAKERSWCARCACLKQNDAASKKGSKGEKLVCEVCLRQFHRKCLQSAGEVGKKKGGRKASENFMCNSCLNPTIENEVEIVQMADEDQEMEVEEKE
jgi:hypothetical protein